MSFNIYTIFILILLVIWIVQAVVLVVTSKFNFWKIALNFTTSLFLLYGALGFFGSAISASGGLDNMPNTFEWPIGSSDNVLVSSKGDYIVPHTSSGRIQIYDENLTFKRGWSVNASGGEFAITGAGDDSFCLYTARGNNNYHYDINGEKLDDESCREDFSRKLMRDNGQSLEVPTPIYYIGFTNPFIAWAFGAIGIGLHFLIRKMNSNQI